MWSKKRKNFLLCSKSHSLNNDGCFFFGWPIRSKFVVKQLHILSTWSLISLLTSGHERKRKTCCETEFNIFCEKIKTFVSRDEKVLTFVSREWKSFYFLFFVTREVAHVSVRKAAAVGSQRQESVAIAMRNCLEVLKQQDKDKRRDWRSTQEVYKPFAASKKEEKKMTICTWNLSKKDSIVRSKKTSLSVSFWCHWILCFQHNLHVAFFCEAWVKFNFFPLNHSLAFSSFPKLRWELPERVFPMSSLVRSCTCTTATLVEA